MTVDKRFAQCLHRSANARKAFAEVNPYASQKSVNEAAERLMVADSTEENMLEILDQEKLEAEAANAQTVTLYTIAQQRAVLALIISGQYRAMKHIRLRNMVVEAYDAPTIAQVMQAVALDRKLAKEQRQLQAAIDMETNPMTVTLPAPPAPAPEPPTAEAPKPAIEQPQQEPQNTPVIPGQFTNPDPGYMPIMQKIALREAEEANLTIEQRLERDYQYNERYKQQQKEKRRQKKRG